MAEIRHLTETFAVAPQVHAEDIPDLKAQGFSSLINNRPDEEAPPGNRSADMRRAAEAEGLTYVHAPFVGAPTPEAVEAAAKASGKTLAYCRSGTRSTHAWALSQAKHGAMSADAIIAAAGEAGYNLSPLKDLLKNLGAK